MNDTQTEVAPEETEVIQFPTEEGTETPTQDMSDEEIMAAIEADFAARGKLPASAPRTISLEELVAQGASIVASLMGYRQVRVKSETTAVKILELSMFWALNNKQTPAPIIPTQEIGSDGSEGEEAELPEPDEVIEASADQSEE